MKPEMSWEIDLGHLESQIDDKTAAVIINNPSNPCGSVYGSQHLKDFLSVILRHKVPVIADEIYEHFVSGVCGEIVYYYSLSYTIDGSRVVHHPCLLFIFGLMLSRSHSTLVKDMFVLIDAVFCCYAMPWHSGFCSIGE